MTFFFNFVEIILLSIICIDTLGFLGESRKGSKANLRDFHRICFTWIFFLIFRSISCSTCSGIIGHFYGMLMLLAKVYVAIPLLGGTQKLYDMVVEKNMIPSYIKEMFAKIKSEAVVGEEPSKDE